MVDRESVTTRLDRLDGILRELSGIQAAGREEYAADVRAQLAAERALQLAVQVCIDVGAHLIAELGLQRPGQYRDVFTSLREAGLEGDLASRLADAAGMRNILVHDYLEVDDDQVWAALGRLDDLRDFAAWALEIASG